MLTNLKYSDNQDKAEIQMNKQNSHNYQTPASFTVTDLKIQ